MRSAHWAKAVVIALRGAAVTVALFWVCVIAIALFQTHKWPTFAAREASLTAFLTVVIFAFTLWIARRDSKAALSRGGEAE